MSLKMKAIILTVIAAALLSSIQTDQATTDELSGKIDRVFDAAEQFMDRLFQRLQASS